MIKKILLILIINFQLLATTYYFSTSGSDGNDGLSTGAPKQTLSAAQTVLDNAAGGDNILFKRGDTWTARGGASTPYAGIVGIDLMDVDGSSGNYITIGAYGTGAKPTFSFTGTGAVFQLTGCTYTVIQDLFLTYSDASIYNRPQTGFHGIGDGGGYDVTFLRVDIDGTGEGYKVQDGNSYITWDGCDTRNTFGGKDIYFTEGNGIFANVPNLTIKNSTFVNNGVNDPADPGHEHGLYLSDCSNLLVENNTFHDMFNAIAIANGSGITVRGNIITNMEGPGIGLPVRNYGSLANILEDILVEQNFIDVNGGWIGIILDGQQAGGVGGTGVIDGVTFKNNVIANSAVWGGILIESIYSLSNLLIANNTLYNNTKTLVLSSNVNYNSNISAKNNIFYNNLHTSGILMQVQDAADLSVISLDANNYYNTTGNTISVSGTNYSLSGFKSAYGSQEANGLSANPLFVSSSNYYLTVNSPAIDAGLTIASVTNDYNGFTRPVGVGYDIGAYEFGSYIPPVEEGSGSGSLTGVTGWLGDWFWGYSSEEPETNLYNFEIQRYLDALTTPLADSQEVNLDNWCGCLKDSLSIDSLPQIFNSFWWFANGTEEAALKNLINRSYGDGTTSGTPTFTQWQGFTGGTNKYINSNFNPTANGGSIFTQNSFSIGWITTDIADTNMVLGAGDQYVGNTDIYASPKIPGNYLEVRMNTTTAEDWSNATSLGHFIATRTASNAISAYKDLSTLGTATTASGTPPNKVFYILCRNVDAGVPSLFWTGLVKGVFFATGLTDEQHRKTVNCNELYLDSIGQGVIP